MKNTSKIAYLLGLPVLAGAFIMCFMNVVIGDVSISIPEPLNLHRPQLWSLILGTDETTSAKVTVDTGDLRLEISKGLVMGQGNEASAVASLIGGGTGNKITSVEKSGIGGGNTNEIGSSYSVIGGGKNNNVYNGLPADGGDDGYANAIAGGSHNGTTSGGTVVGGNNNNAVGVSVILGGQNNQIGGDGSIALGSNSQGGGNSFSWNSSVVEDYSAIIMASGGTLIGTYDPITGVNLVVEGGVKIGTGELTGNVGEIRMQDGCFYGSDGSEWHIINKRSRESCPKVTCTVGSISFQPGESRQVYTEPYALDCSRKMKEVGCMPDGTLSLSGEFYPYCYELSGGVLSEEEESECGSVDGGLYVYSPTITGLCRSGTPSAVISGSFAFTWTCTTGSSVVSCAATKVYQCNGEQPVGPGVIWGSATQMYSDTLKSWTQVEQGVNPGVCQWTCKAGYSLSGNECVFDGTECVFGGYTTWNNDKFLDENFWALNGGNPTDCDIISALYGSNSSDITAYTAGRSGWQWGVNCDVLNLDVVHVTTNNQIGNTLQKNTIYVLDVDNIQSDIGFSVNGNCIAVVSSLPHGSKVLTYRSDGYKANIHPWSFSILDNLSVDGVFNADGAKHGRNHHGINVWDAYNTLNNVNVYNAGHGIVTSVGQFNVFNNMKIFNNDGDGIRLIGSDYSSFNNMQIFNNRDAGLKWSGTRPTHYNLFNNIQTYNNGVGIEITSVSTNNKFNNVRVFNNNQSVINSNSTNTYNGLLDVFGNGSNGYGLTAAGAQYGWTAGVQGSNSNGWSLWDLMTNPMTAGGNYLLNMGGSYGNARQVKNYILIDGYSYGNGILKQTQPVVWKGGNVVPVGNYDGSKFIGSM